MDYGIANKTGKVPRDQALNIVQYAHEAGIDTLDTAYVYGDSEEIIGHFLSGAKRAFKVVSKLPPLDDKSTLEDIEDAVKTSRDRLKIQVLYGYLIHRPRDFLQHKGLWNALETLREKGIMKKIGFSICTTEELEMIFKNNIAIDILQLPYSIFDRRFEKYFSELKERNIEIHARSAFLQGLVFLTPGALPSNLSKAKDPIEKLHKASRALHLPIHAVCINFVLLQSYIDKVVIGVDHLEHLKKNVEALKAIHKVKKAYGKLMPLEIDDEQILLPYNWNIK
ncbi:MAG: aldo/keto reductase [Candidatus Omnitrophica bacterium]|nr:aldo/keto reductase [Candidatus Omnitrophota bacterium]